MALIKEYIDGAGITANYWRLSRIVLPTLLTPRTSTVNSNFETVGWSSGTLTFELYRDTQARKVENRDPMLFKDISVAGSFFMGLTMSTDINVAKQTIYNKSSKIPGFENAVQDEAIDDVTPPVVEETPVVPTSEPAVVVEPVVSPVETPTPEVVTEPVVEEPTPEVVTEPVVEQTPEEVIPTDPAV